MNPRCTAWDETGLISTDWLGKTYSLWFILFLGKITAVEEPNLGANGHSGLQEVEPQLDVVVVDKDFEREVQSFVSGSRVMKESVV